MRMDRICLVIATLTSVVVMVSESAVSFTTKPAVQQDGGKTIIRFAVGAATDVEVAILDADGTVVRHLAAGVLGAKDPPPEPLRPGLSQRLEWDGKDDYGVSVSESPEREGVPLRGAARFRAPETKGNRGNDGSERSSEVRLKPEARHPKHLSVRIRAGMGVKVSQIAGGDPYAYYSKLMGRGDHAAWRITGLDVKPDGTVYVLGNANNHGPPALRAYTAAGEYLRTVYPPPAGKPIESMKGWGIAVRADGTYTPRYRDIAAAAVTTTFMGGQRASIATLVPSAAEDELLLMDRFRLMRIRTDGTIPPDPMLDGMLVNQPPMGGGRRGPNLVGPMQVAVAPDGKHFYLGGIFAASSAGRKRTGAATTGPWRDGQIYKVDVATRKARVFFALDPKTLIGDLAARGKSAIADFKYGTYAALQGVAVDAEGHVFVCDRQHKRVVVLDGEAKVLREIPVEYPDAVAAKPQSKTLYVTTRRGHYHGKGVLKLVVFNDWTRDAAPAAVLPLCEVQHYSQPTHLAVAETGGQCFVWVAYTTLPVRVYRDNGDGLELAKDFYETSKQRALDVQHVVVDRATEHLYVSDGFGRCFRVRNWQKPVFEMCMTGADKPLGALTLAVDERRRWLYGRNDRRPVCRYALDREFLAPAPLAGSGNNAFTPPLTQGWFIGVGKTDRGFTVGPDGGLATLGALGTGPNYAGLLHYFKPDPKKTPWDPLPFEEFNKARRFNAGGIRFDPQGNLYVGRKDGPPATPPKGFEKDAAFLRSTGCIWKYAPTGSREHLFPTAPAKPDKIYDVHFGAFSPKFCRTPRFTVDGYGRIVYPTALLPRVSMIDNAGNPILSFGQYANRDSTAGLDGDLVPTKEIPIGYPSSVDATDDSIYVSDIVNIRVLRLAKTFAACETVSLR